MVFLLKNWRLFAIAAAVVVVFLAGWNVNGWRWENKVSAMQLAWSTAATEASEAARDKEQQLAAQVAELDARYTAERKIRDEETNSLRAAVDAGARRLRIAATCPADRVPATAAGPGVDTGAGAELTADARSAYFDLRSGLSRVEAKLAACRGILIDERKN